MKYTILVAALFATFVGSVAFAQDGGEARDILSEIASAAFAPPTAQSHPADAFLTSPANPADVLRSADESHAAFDDRKVSGGKAFVLSLLLPGLGHRYVHGGDWDGWASIFAVADAGLWAGLIGSEWRRHHLVDSYTTLAATYAGAQTEGKDRDFFLYLAGYRSSEEFVEVQLRIRNWGQIGYVDDPAYQWEWISEEQFAEYGRIREDAETLRRRRTFFVTSLVANRLISSFTALRAAGRARSARMEVSLGVPPVDASAPLLELRYRF